MLTTEQVSVIIQFLALLAFDERSAYQDCAMQVIEEYWMPGNTSRLSHLN